MRPIRVFSMYHAFLYIQYKKTAKNLREIFYLGENRINTGIFISATPNNCQNLRNPVDFYYIIL